MTSKTKRVYVFLATFLFMLVLFVMGLSLAFQSLPKVMTARQFQSTFTQLHYIAKSDEYVIVEENNSVTLGLEATRMLMERWPIGEGQAELVISATFKYFVKLSELQYQLEDRTLLIQVPKLYLSTPVAFDTSSIRNTSSSSWLGPSSEVMRDNLMTKVSDNLRLQGKMQIDNVRDKAAESLAENLNSFFTNNNASGYYDQIKVVFGDDRQQLVRLFEFNNSYCGDKACDFMLELPNDAMLIFD